MKGKHVRLIPTETITVKSQYKYLTVKATALVSDASGMKVRILSSSRKEKELVDVPIERVMPVSMPQLQDHIDNLEAELYAR